MDTTPQLPPPVWVANQSAFQEMLAHLRHEPALAVDTESNSLYAYYERVCLVQISVPGTDYLVDPLAVTDLSGLGPLLADPGTLKVMHGAEYDLAVLNRDFGFTLENLFDTMWASRILGWPGYGLGTLLQAHFGVIMDKRLQRANWGVRPLPPGQLDYARLDTHYLLPLHDIQARELESRGRWPQARHRFQALMQVRWEPRGFDPDGFWRLDQARALDDRGRGVLRELYLFRDERARAEDRPPFKVLSDTTVVLLSERRPGDTRSLGRVRGLSHKLVGRYAPGLLAAIRRGAARPLSWEERPRPFHNGRGSGDRPSRSCQARFEALRTWRNATAEERGVEPDLVLNNQTLWAVAQRDPSRRAELSQEGLLARWQVDEFGDQLLALLGRERQRRPETPSA